MKDQHSFNVCNIQSYIDTFSILIAKRVAICVYKTDLILIRNLSKSLRPFVLNSFAVCFCRFLGFELFLMLLLSVADMCMREKCFAKFTLEKEEKNDCREAMRYFRDLRPNIGINRVIKVYTI